MTQRRQIFYAGLASLLLLACSSDEAKKPDAQVLPIPDQTLADTQPPVDQAMAPDLAPDAAACSIVGKWQGSGDGVPFTIEFLANGDADYTVPSARTAGGGGTWSLEGDVLTWDTDRQDCDAVVASYSIAFAPDCNSVTFTVIQDECTGRKLATDGATFPRVQ